MNDIIALWTHPRSISTAFERVMIERGDFNVLHEPFSYLYYVHEGDASIDQQYVDPDHPTDYPGIRNHILKASDHGPVFFKDMCAHCYGQVVEDDAFLEQVTHTFLIRDPAKAIASYYAMNKDVTLEEIGLEQLCSVFKRTQALGLDTIVVDADDLEDDPDGTVQAYCRAIDIPFIPEAMTWESGHQKEWDIWKDWHRDAAQTTGIQKNVETFETTVDNSAHLKSFYNHQAPYYEALYEQRLEPVVSD
ncbi:MAG: sulfotransferase family protein [Desulfobacteraceae bacterium]|nr:MAG: sulfotransferase family protein [Desulfobacteraceae bacterium]